MKFNRSYRHDLKMVMGVGKDILKWEGEYEKAQLRREYESTFSVFGSLLAIIITVAVAVLIGGLR